MKILRSTKETPAPFVVRSTCANWSCIGWPLAACIIRLREVERALGAGYALAPTGDNRITILPLCEIAVDRAGILRAQRDNPLALNTILDEMMLALEPATHDQAPEDLESADYFAISEAE
jgi:hypothetical protein